MNILRYHTRWHEPHLLEDTRTLPRLSQGFVHVEWGRCPISSAACGDAAESILPRVMYVASSLLPATVRHRAFLRSDHYSGRAEDGRRTW